MKLLVQNGKNINIERSIMSLSGGTANVDAVIRAAMNQHPFPAGNANILNLYGSGHISCWGLSPSSRSVAGKLRAGIDHFILFENKKNAVIVPPRVFTGKILHVEENEAFGDVVWNEPGVWRYIFFLADVKRLSYTKDFLCQGGLGMQGENWYRFGPRLF